MPEYLSPGVYVEEVSSGAKPIEGVSTSTAGFAGPTERGPLTPRLVTSWLDFERWFGSFVSPAVYEETLCPFLPYSAQGFFTNGGQRLYVARVVSQDAPWAEIQLPTFDSQSTFNVAAVGPGTWGRNLILKIDDGSGADPNDSPSARLFRLTVLYYKNGIPNPFVDPTVAANRSNPGYREPSVMEAFDNLSVDPAAQNDVVATVNKGSRLVQVSFTGPPARPRNQVEMETTATGLALFNDGTLETTVELVARHRGTWGNLASFDASTAGTLNLSWGFGAGASVNGVTRLDYTESFTESTVEELVDAINTDSKLVTAAIVPAGGGAAKGRLGGGVSTRLRFLADTASAPVAVQVATGEDGDVELTAREALAGADGDAVAFVSTDDTELVLRLPVSAADPSSAYTETYAFPTLGTVDALVTAVNDGSALVTGLKTEDEGELEGNLTGGDVREPVPTVSDFKDPRRASPLTPDEKPLGGLGGLALIDGIALLAAPDSVNPGIDDNQEIANAVIDQCEILRDRFAVLSTLGKKSDVSEIDLLRDTSYGATYYPWIRIYDSQSREPLLIPSTGYVVGLYARNDNDKGVWHAPANEVLRGLYLSGGDPEDGPLEYLVNKGQQDVLNPRGVNVIRDFRNTGRGVRVWGARTMSSDPEWRYVNVRRLFIYVEKSVEEGTQWVVFEPNVETTWAGVTRSISGFLNQLWRAGGLQGQNAAEAYFVKCDRTTMTQDDIDNGRMICLVGIAPVKPAEFVIIRIGQKTLEAG